MRPDRRVVRVHPGEVVPRVVIRWRRPGVEVVHKVVVAVSWESGHVRRVAKEADRVCLAALIVAGPAVHWRRAVRMAFLRVYGNLYAHAQEKRTQHEQAYFHVPYGCMCVCHVFVQARWYAGNESDSINHRTHCGSNRVASPSRS